MKRLFAVLFILATPAVAATDTVNYSITSTSTWTDLGTGPLRVELLNGVPVTLVVSNSATTPAAGLAGHQLNVNQKFMDFQTSDDVWAVANSATPATLAVTALSGLSGGGGGGGTSNITQWGNATLGAATAVGTAASGNVITSNVFDVGTVYTGFSVTSGATGDLGLLSMIDRDINGPIAASVSSTTTPLTAHTVSSNTALDTNTQLVNGVAILAGAGATGTGSQRTTVAQDATTTAGANPGRTYNTIAASQTSYVLSSTQGGATGATGDYLAFCVVVPGTTSPGNVIIYDNSTAIYTFAGGASSVTTLISWPVPIGAVSTSGAWKVTTGTNVSAVCTGKFT